MIISNNVKSTQAYPKIPVGDIKKNYNNNNNDRVRNNNTFTPTHHTMQIKKKPMENKNMKK
jgi:hypothetical protein